MIEKIRVISIQKTVSLSEKYGESIIDLLISPWYSEENFARDHA